LGRCPLYKKDSESIIHLFKECPFSISVWKIIYQVLKLKRKWVGDTLLDCIKRWYMEKIVPTLIATHVIWFTWHEHNKENFEDSTPSLQEVLYKTLAHQSSISSQLKIRPPRTVLINHQQDSALTWFDRATIRDGSRSSSEVS